MAMKLKPIAFALMIVLLTMLDAAAAVPLKLCYSTPAN